MKKALLITAVLTFAVGMAACSKSNDTTPTETTTAAVEEETTEDTEEDIDEDYVDGLITAIDGNVLTIQSDEDGTEADYDISDAEVIQEFDFAEGDWVEVIFPEGSTDDPIPAISLEVLESVIGENSDPSVEGKVIDATNEHLVLEVDGEEYSMSTANAYIVGEDGIRVDQNATVTYLGDLDDEPMAVKIVMQDSYDSDEADQFAFTGEVAQVNADSNSIVLESAEGDFFTFIPANDSDIEFGDFEEGEILQIFYTGSIADKEIVALYVD
ncbi:MAG: hypothetical protein LUE65_13325 [Clostridiales bacterium]|nr:hypothetical protein [Clostridiales bacterium]